MPRRLPSLNAVKAFEAAARSKGFTRAAEELFVTPGAVSQQVKALETELGLKLFNRERQRLVVTEAGREYLAVVRDALDQIALGTVMRIAEHLLVVDAASALADLGSADGLLTIGEDAPVSLCVYVEDCLDHDSISWTI